MTTEMLGLTLDRFLWGRRISHLRCRALIVFRRRPTRTPPQRIGSSSPSVTT